MIQYINLFATPPHHKVFTEMNNGSFILIIMSCWPTRQEVLYTSIYVQPIHACAFVTSLYLDNYSKVTLWISLIFGVFVYLGFRKM